MFYIFTIFCRRRVDELQTYYQSSSFTPDKRRLQKTSLWQILKVLRFVTSTSLLKPFFQLFSKKNVVTFPISSLDFKMIIKKTSTLSIVIHVQNDCFLICLFNNLYCPYCSNFPILTNLFLQSMYAIVKDWFSFIGFIGVVIKCSQANHYSSQIQTESSSHCVTADFNLLRFSRLLFLF